MIEQRLIHVVEGAHTLGFYVHIRLTTSKQAFDWNDRNSTTKSKSLWAMPLTWLNVPYNKQSLANI